MAEVFNDISNELNRRKPPRVSVGDRGGLGLLRGGSGAKSNEVELVPLAANPTSSGGGGRRGVVGGGASKDTDGLAEFAEGADRDDTGGVSSNTLTATTLSQQQTQQQQSTWDSNFISLFVS